MSDLLSTVADSVLSPFASMATSWITNTARESLNKNVTKSNLKTQKSYDEWTMMQDRSQEKWMQDLYYSLQNNEYYNLARKYGENTASWAVNGLKRAGLNPILAAGNYNMSSNLGNASPAPPGSSVGRRSSIPSAGMPSAVHAPTNIAQSMQASSAAEQSKAETDKIKQETPYDVFLKYLQTQVTKLMPDATKANTAETVSRAELNEAQANKIKADTETALARTAGIKQETENKRHNFGINGPAGAGLSLGSRIKERLSDRGFSFLPGLGLFQGVDWLLNHNGTPTDNDHSAKELKLTTPADIERHFGHPGSPSPSDAGVRWQSGRKRRPRDPRKIYDVNDPRHPDYGR